MSTAGNIESPTPENDIHAPDVVINRFGKWDYKAGECERHLGVINGIIDDGLIFPHSNDIRRIRFHAGWNCVVETLYTGDDLPGFLYVFDKYIDTNVRQEGDSNLYPPYTANVNYALGICLHYGISTGFLRHLWVGTMRDYNKLCTQYEKVINSLGPGLSNGPFEKAIEDLNL